MASTNNNNRDTSSLINRNNNNSVVEYTEPEGNTRAEIALDAINLGEPLVVNNIVTNNNSKNDCDVERDSLYNDNNNNRNTSLSSCYGLPFRNFVLMSFLFSANHGTITSCLGLATSRLGAIGAWQSGVLYLFYVASAICGGSYLVKKLGGRNGMVLGMFLYCIYVGCFSFAATFPEYETFAAVIGASFGGIGAGFLWIAQGNYFTEAAKHYHLHLVAERGGNDDYDLGKCTSFFAGVFAFLYLILEVIIRSLSTALVVAGFDWRAIFGIYTVIACATTFGMMFIIDYPKEEDNDDESSDMYSSCWNKATVVLRLLQMDPKMKYMIGINALFGFAGAFLNSYVNGEVVVNVLHDDDSRYVGVLTSWMALTAAFVGLFASSTAGGASSEGRGRVLITGAMGFFFVGFLFLLFPNSSSPFWNIYTLLLVYTLHGIGRASFESTLKATFAEYFPSPNTTAAFGNIVLQNGLASAIGYVLTFVLQCSKSSRYCVQYSDGSLHNVLIFELLICGTAILAILGYCRASEIFENEKITEEQRRTEQLNNNNTPVPSIA